MSPAASSSSSSSRWCPTPEQLMILEHMYRNGIRTPNASQIQQITAHLSCYGKIQGKNVFYWFQNHKARERQKLRKKLISKQLRLQQQQLIYYHHLQHNFVSTGSSLQQLCCCNSSTSLPHHQGTVLDEDTSRQMMNYYTWKVDAQTRVEMEKSMMNMYGHDLMMMGVEPPNKAPGFTRPPLKTLELFPVTATNLKEESSNNNKSKNIKDELKEETIS